MNHPRFRLPTSAAMVLGAVVFALTAPAGNGQAPVGKLYYPSDVKVGKDGTIYVCDCKNHRIVKLAADGSLVLVAGDPNRRGDSHRDGEAAKARFFSPTGIAVAADGAIYVADTQNNCIRKIADGMVTTIAGKPGVGGFSDGKGQTALFKNPQYLALDRNGSLIVSDHGNHAIRKVTPAGEVTTLAGDGKPGHADGHGAAAEFTSPSGIAIDNAGAIYVAEFGGPCIRRISPSLDVSTIAGASKKSGILDGPAHSARFTSPCGIALAPDGSVYVSDHFVSLIRRLSPKGMVTTAAGDRSHLDGGTLRDGAATVARFQYPMGIAFAADGSLLIIDSASIHVRKLSKSGVVSSISD